ncbi:protein turtle [Diabrotica virgifera virgifera]|uniref:Protein turtle-like n=1 Tax=Diabrotica virgifera virgifera TaxID=50390 RepID=A0A6P7GP31_DIAVI|nr:protein turtle [Diabrotica virgifera virgifera]
MVAKRINLIVLSIFLILQSSYGDDYTKEYPNDTEDVQGPPEVTLTTPRRVLVHLGQNLNINCSATGAQPMEIGWKAWKRDMPSSVYTNKGYIKFNNIQSEHAGVYWCMATNPAGTGGAIAEVIIEDN